MSVHEAVRSAKFHLNELNFEHTSLYCQETDEMLNQYKLNKNFEPLDITKRNSMLDTDLSSIHPVNNSDNSTVWAQSFTSPTLITPKSLLKDPFSIDLREISNISEESGTLIKKKKQKKKQSNDVS